VRAASAPAFAFASFISANNKRKHNTTKELFSVVVVIV
jgi:hypothetical protein